MRGHWFFRVLRFLRFAAVFIAVFGFVVMELWNWLLPALFGWHRIDYWQALGILVLSKILFSGFRGGPGRHWGWRGRMMDRWEKMTPEEREKFRLGMRRRCGGFQPPEAEAKSPTA
jgi:hypothetical protein